jgi:nicotinamidase-related amidase
MTKDDLHPNCLNRESTVLLVIDIQEAFKKVIPDIDTVVKNTVCLVKGFTILSLPVLVSEQYPKGLGPTVEPVKNSCQPWSPVEKTAFSCSLAPEFTARLETLAPKSVVVCGIESHVCVNQTVHGLLYKGYTVHVAIDAIASREVINHETALRKMEKSGALPTTVEMCLFELMRDACIEEFKEIQQLIM